MKEKSSPGPYKVIVMECLEGGDLCDRVNAMHKLSEQEIAPIFKQLFITFDHLHLRRLLFCDFKLENAVLVSNDPRNLECKVIDFGMLQELPKDKNDVMTKACLGTPPYLAPESRCVNDDFYATPPIVMQGTQCIYNFFAILLSLTNCTLCWNFNSWLELRQYSTASDVWQLGVALFCTACLYTPFSNNGVKEPFYDEYLNKVSPLLQDLLRKILVDDPQIRYTISMVLKHPWFNITKVSAAFHFYSNHL